MKQITLKKLYQQYKEEFNRTAIHPHPAELLSLLLLPEKEKYPALSGNSGEFYQYYKKAIDKKIELVIVDFAISKKEIIEYIEKTGIFYKEENYEHDKIWTVFCHGFGVVQWGNMYHQDATPEQLHNEFSAYWGREPLSDNKLDEQINLDKPKTRIRKK